MLVHVRDADFKARNLPIPEEFQSEEWSRAYIGHVLLGDAGNAISGFLIPIVFNRNIHAEKSRVVHMLWNAINADVTDENDGPHDWYIKGQITLDDLEFEGIQLSIEGCVT